MRQFFKFLFASCLGVFLAMVILFSIGSMVIGQLVSRAGSPQAVKPNSVLYLTLEESIPEQSNNILRDNFDIYTTDVIGLNDIVTAIDHAKEDDDIKGIFMELSNVRAGQATAATIRDALIDFKESGKFVVAYSEYYTQNSYYLGSVADKVYVHPLGGIDFAGFAAVPIFFKDLLDKIGVEVEVFWVGKYKGASEPYRRNDLSEENRQQIREYMEEVYEDYLNDISASREIPVSELRKIADELLIRKPEDCITYRMADAIAYEDEVLDDIRSRIGLKEEDKIKTVTIGSYFKSSKKPTDFAVKDKVAVIYAEGTIVSGKSSPGQIGDDKYIKLIRKLRKDDRIRAVVLRVNSPGGSALASENIWRELELLKKEGKPVIASMGDVAASGGYYISCSADSIFAQSNTVTGSIGVVVAIPNARELLNDKIGVHVDTVKTGKYSIGFHPFLETRNEVKEVVQSSIEDVYNTFLRRVADGRNMRIEEVHEVAQGRVWVGDAAKRLGLVDALGGLDEAVAAAASKAGLEEYRIVEYPKLKEPIQQLLEELTGSRELVGSTLIQEQLGDLFPYFQQLQAIRQMKGPQTIMPFYFSIH